MSIASSDRGYTMAKKKRKPREVDSAASGPKPKRKPARPPKRVLRPPDSDDGLSALKTPPMPLALGAARSRERMAKKYLVKAAKAKDPDQWDFWVKAAVTLWPDCAQGYVMMAERAASPKRAIELYEEGVAAGERALGPQFFTDCLGNFGNWPEARPYLEARLGLGQALWVVGRRPESISQYQEILRLNSADHQGVRYNLAAALLEMGRDEDVEALLNRYPQELSATWAYCIALSGFRKTADTPATRQMLASALALNPYVPDYLTGAKNIPARPPRLIGPGDRSEAIDYTLGFLNAWRATPGAIEWMKKAGGSGSRSRAKAKPKASRTTARAPSSAVKKRLLKLPQSPEVIWQTGARRLPVWINTDTEPYRPWMLLVMTRENGLILGQVVLERPPTAAQVWDALTRAMSARDTTEPHRPASIEFGASLPVAEIGGDLDDLGIRIEPVEQLELIDDAFDHLCDHISGERRSLGLMDMPAVGPEEARGFFHAAAHYYRGTLAASRRRRNDQDRLRAV